MLILPFTRELAQLSPEEFVRRLLVERWARARCWWATISASATGRPAMSQVLAELGRKLGFETEIVPAVTCRGRVVSSSGIRELIRAGQVSLAARLLQHAYALEGEVVSGRGVGSKQTVPTLNLATGGRSDSGARRLRHPHPRPRRRPRMELHHQFGYRPTFGASDQLSSRRSCWIRSTGESPRRIRVEFLRRVRDERKFDTPEALRGADPQGRARGAELLPPRAKAWIGRVPCTSC